MSNPAMKSVHDRTLELVYRPLSGLVAFAKNPRTHSDDQITEIAASIKEFGFTNPVLIDEAGGIIAGHGRVLAATLLGMDTLPTIELTGLTETQRRAYVIVDNQLALNAGWNADLLRDMILELQAENFDIDLLGFPDLTDILADPNAGGGGDPDVAPPLPAVPTSKLGDVWVLGTHKVCCGDATTAASWHALLGTEIADACVTDPPYNVAYGGKAEMLQRYDKGHRNTSRILNDDMSDAKFRAFCAAFYIALHKVLKPGGTLYVFHSETERRTFTDAFLAAGFKLSGCIIWRKNTLVLGRSDYQFCHEPILYGWKPGKSHRWFGGRKQTSVQEWGNPEVVKALPGGKYQITVGENVFVVDGTATLEQVEPSVIRYDKPRANDVHPTMKPVGLCARLLRNSARRGDLIVDPFGGSGSTMIAADTLGMSARLLELDPAYVDVIVMRWQAWTGRRAVHAETGAEFPIPLAAAA